MDVKNDKMEAISSLLINLADNVDATDVTLLETKILEFLDSIKQFSIDPINLVSIIDQCVSQQATKTPLYAILITLLAKDNKEFVEKCIQTIYENFCLDINNGKYIECTLRLRCLCILALFDIISRESLFSFYQSMIETIQQTHNSTLIRSCLSSLLYVYRYISVHNAPFTSDMYSMLISSLHSYFQSSYLTSSTYINQSTGFLKKSLKDSDLFFSFDNALTTVASLIPQVTTNPSIRIHLLSLDFCYSAVIRVIYEVLNIEYEKEEGEEEEEGETQDSHRSRLRQYCMSDRINYQLSWQFTPDISTTVSLCDHFIYPILSSSDGVSFTVLPGYQTLLIQEFIEHLLILFIPSWQYASRFIHALNSLISPVHEIDTRTLQNNIASAVCQVLFSFIMNPTFPPSYSLQATNTCFDLAVQSINYNEDSNPSFISRFSPAVFKYVDTLANKAEVLSFEATCKLIDFFAFYLTNTNYFWPWSKWENVSQCSVTSCYRIVISEFIIACASLAGYSTLTKVIPPAVLSLCEIGSFIPTQPIRDQDREYTDYIIKGLEENKNLQSFFDFLLKEKYNNRGPFIAELSIVLSYCLKEGETSKIIAKLHKFASCLKTLKIDKEIMIIEEVCRNCHLHYMKTLLILKELIDLEIISLYDYFRFLRITKTNHSLFYYWKIADYLLSLHHETKDYIGLLSALLVIMNQSIQEQHSGYILSILEQRARTYKELFLKKEDADDYKEDLEEELMAIKLTSERVMNIRASLLQ